MLGQLHSDDKIRVIKGGVSYDFTDRFQGVYMIDTEVSRGLNILDATKTGSDLLSRANGHSDFTKVVINLSRQQSIDKWGFMVAAQGQYADSALLSSEEFGFGGTTFGRAYDSSEITGDQGAAFRMEVQYNGEGIKAIHLDGWQVYVFYDGGVAWQNDSPPGEALQRAATSAGLGIKLYETKYMSADLQMAKPLTKIADATNDKEPRYFFSVTARY
jgi:hemolysin activation/secretion protein